jgi:Eco57I restriction-modification methylase
LRHDLGEYYTPDWLADHVLNDLGYEGDPDERLLDPACGSGTFLVMAINRIRRWYDANREKCAYGEGELLKKILTNVMGFDLNPLAVMAARTNYLVAIKDLVRYVDHVEIPVYLCDSIVTPAEYGDLFTGGQGKVARVPCSAMKPPHLLVPKEIAKSPGEVAKYADVLEKCIKNASPAHEFIARCNEEALNITATEAHLDLYRELVRLDKENKNGIWARMIKNNFAPLFVGRFDFVAGNPPWVAWNNLPAEYREQSKPIWRKYGFFTQKGYRALVPAGPLEFSALFVFACADSYLKDSKQLGFVITQTIFKSKGAGEGFRRFRLPSGVTLRPKIVHDLSALKPFDATNRTAVLILERGGKPQMSVPYIVWRPAKDASADVRDLAIEVVPKVVIREECSATPVNPENQSSPWRVTCPSEGDVSQMRGAAQYRARSGIHTHGANAIFWLERVKQVRAGVSLYRNVTERAKKKVMEKTVPLEDALVYPLLRERDTDRWSATPALCVLLTHSESTNKNPIPIQEMRRSYIHTFEYLEAFRSELKDRSMMEKLGEGGPYYRLFKIGPYTFAHAKVVWREQSSQLSAAVVTTTGGRVIIPDHKLYLIPCQTQEEAHFICALLNARASVKIVKQTVLPTSQTTHILDFLPIPKFDPAEPTHIELCALSKKCHAVVATDASALSECERKIDEIAELLLLSKN